MARNEPDLRPVGWALAAGAFIRWLSLRVWYVIAATVALLAASSVTGAVTGRAWAGFIAFVVLAVFFIGLSWRASGGPRLRDR